MATDSLIGFASTTLYDPGAPPVFLDSDIGYVSQSLVDPNPYTDSEIGYASRTLFDPGAAPNDSTIGYASKTLMNPVSPYIIKDGIPVEGHFFIKQGGSDVEVKLWRIIKGGIEVPLTRPTIDDDGFVPHVTIPTLTNTGVKAGVTRTPYTGPLTITTPTLIQDKDITQQIINQSVLIMINCNDTAIGAAGPQAMVMNTHVNANLYAERCTFRPATYNFYTNSAQGHDIHFYRCYIERTVDGFSPYANGDLDCCYIADLAWFVDDSPVHTDGSGTHNDGCQHHGGTRLHIHGCAIHGYKFNALGTPALDGSSDSRWPQIGQIVLSQHTAFWVPGYLAAERALTIGSDGFPLTDSSWGGAPLIHHNWIWGGDNGIKIASLAGSGMGTGGGRVDIAAWVFNNTWMDYPGTKGFTYPYPIRIDTNVWLNGVKYPATTGRGWYETTSPSFHGNNMYSNDASIPAIWRGKPVGVRVDAVTASVPRP